MLSTQVVPARGWQESEEQAGNIQGERRASNDRFNRILMVPSSSGKS
jgi:hypothetical protein